MSNKNGFGPNIIRTKKLFFSARREIKRNANNAAKMKEKPVCQIRHDVLAESNACGKVPKPKGRAKSKKIKKQKRKEQEQDYLGRKAS